MANQEHLFKVEVADDFNFKVELGGYEKLDVLGKLGKTMNAHSKMSQWLDDPKVPAAQKDQYMPIFRNMLRTINFLWQLLEVAGVAESEIREHVELPF